MSSLVEKTRSVISSEVDDFFENEIIVSHLNSTLEDVLSVAMQKEQNTNVSLRVLDSLRSESTDTINSWSDRSGLYYGVVAKPASLLRTLAIFVDGVVCKEITTNNLISLGYGNLYPTSDEKYYVVSSSNYVIYNDVNLQSDLEIWYLKNPDTITESDFSLQNSLSRLESAVIYGAAHRLLMQETAREPQANLNNFFKQEYQEQIQLNLY